LHNLSNNFLKTQLALFSFEIHQMNQASILKLACHLASPFLNITRSRISHAKDTLAHNVINNEWILFVVCSLLLDQLDLLEENGVLGA
jgi:hypothetical protein